MLLCLATLVGPAGCAADGPSPPRELILATTTSTDDSGLLDVLLPAFEREHPSWDVKVIAVGTGQALELGRRKDADVLLVHAPPAESTFVEKGHGTGRRELMHNDFLIVGPPGDPAGTRGGTDPIAAVRRIAAAGAPFVSRGDDSGTHRTERALWSAAGLSPGGRWYLEAGQGMGEVLRIAAETGAYTLTDRATFLVVGRGLGPGSGREDRVGGGRQGQLGGGREMGRGEPDEVAFRDRRGGPDGEGREERVREADGDGYGLAVMIEGGERLFNQYSVIPVAGTARTDGARLFAEWITSPSGQTLIRRYGAESFGHSLFTPNAAPPR